MGRIGDLENKNMKGNLMKKNDSLKKKFNEQEIEAGEN